MAEAEAQQELDSLRIVENSLASVTREQKEVFMIVYQKFAGVLRDLINSNPDVESSYVYKWVFGWYREILRVVSVLLPLLYILHVHSQLFFYCSISKNVEDS